MRLSSDIGRRATGFSLVEVLITLSISLLALGALIKFQGELFQGDTLARSRSQAALLAEQRLETLYAAAPTAGPGTMPDGSDTWSADLTAIDAGAAVYIRTWSTSVDAAIGLARIDVAVNWSDAAGNAYDVRLVALADTTAITYGASALVNYDFIRLP